MLTFEMSKKYKGTGISNGLDRGLLVYHDGILLLEEGMGLGAVAVQKEGYTYFASITQIRTSLDRIEVNLSIDQMLQRKIYGVSSIPLTRFIEKVCTHMYKNRERNQGIWFKIGGLINLLLQIKVAFVKVAAKGQLEVQYQIKEQLVHVNLSGEFAEPVDKIFVMNELSGNLFDQGVVGGKNSPPPSGWQKTKDDSQLYSKLCQISFAAKEINKPENLKTQLYWGREADKNHCWAGFIYQLHCETREFHDFKYFISFQEGV